MSDLVHRIESTLAERFGERFHADAAPSGRDTLARMTARRVCRRYRAQDVAILRIEQLYPFAHKQFEAELKKYDNATEVGWVQDEPQNQGPWFYIEHHLKEGMKEGQKLAYSGRPASASPAVG